ncbi:uncharacterized protein LOC144618852 isoform X2 [Crassostrea virginica]
MMDLRTCLTVMGLFLSAFLMLYDCKMLDGYKFPVYTTDFCPKNEIEWKKRSSVFNCPKETSYACFPNEDITVLLEFCYPLENILIHEDICLFLRKDRSEVDSFDCIHFQYGCPTSPYTGATVYRYPSCILIGDGCFLAELSCKRASTEDGNGGTADSLLIFVLIGTFLLLCVCGYILFHFLKWRRKKINRRNQNDEARVEEEMKSLVLNEEGETPKGKGYEIEVFDQWKAEDVLFVQTKATEQVEKMIETRNLVIVTGHSGSGKSATVHHIALKHRIEGWAIKSVDTIEEIKEAYSSKDYKENKTLFVFDDPIGKEVFDDILYSSWKKYEDTLKLFLQKVKLLMTCRKQILYDSRTSGLFQEEKQSIIEIDDDNHKLSPDEKIKIFKKYISGDNFSTDQIETVLKVDIYFPLLCKLFIQMKDRSFDNLKSVFINPHKIIEKEIKDYRVKDTKKYCALVCLFFFKNRISLRDLHKNEDLFNKCIKLCGTPSLTPPTIISSLKPLEGFFVKCIDNVYQFYHDFIMEVTTCVFGNDYPLETIKEADLSFLRKRIRIGKDESDAFTISVVKEYIGEIVERFFDGLSSDRFMEVVLNPCLRNTYVTDGLITEMKKKIDILENIIKKKTTNVYNHSTRMTELFEEESRDDIQKEKKEYSLSKIDFIYAENACSPLFALIVFGYDKLALFALKKLRNIKTDLIGNSFICAVCCNGSLNLFQEFEDENLNAYLAEFWKGLSPIHIASMFHNDKLLEKLLLDHDADINEVSKDHSTPLYLACKNEHYSTVNLLLEKGANVNICPHYRKSPLQAACYNGYMEIVQILLDKGADINGCTNDHGEPLYAACKNGHENIVRLLLDNCADVNLSSKKGASPLYAACENGHENIVCLLLDKGADANSNSKYEKGALYAACKNGHERIIHLLLDKGADVNLRSNHDKSPLYAACGNGHEHVVHLLLEKGLDLNLDTSCWKSPLYPACKNKHEQIALLLLDKGAGLNLSSEDVDHFCYSACENGLEHVVQFLLNRGADVNYCSFNGPLLYAACRNEHTNIVRLLLDAGADPNFCSNYKDSPLYEACFYGYEQIVLLLLDKGADLSLEYARHSVYRACEKGYEDIVKLLLDRGADINLCIERDVLFEQRHKKTVGNKKTLLYAACKNGHENIVNILLKEGADINLWSESLLCAACGNGHENIVRLLIDKGADVNLCSMTAGSPLFAASGNGHKNIVCFLLDKGADVNLCSREAGSPLYAACKNGREHIARLLLDNDADISLCSEYKQSPLYAGCEHGHEHIVRLLLDNGVDVNFCTESDVSPLFVACKNGHEGIVSLLLDKGADINLCSKYTDGAHYKVYDHDYSDGKSSCAKCSKSLLYIACLEGHENIVHLLLKKGADPNFCSEYEGSPLYAAYESNHISIVHLLLKSGATVNLCPKYEGSLLYAACKKGNKVFVRFLLTKGADVNLYSEYKGSPLYAACKNGHESIVRLLIVKGAKVNACSEFKGSPLYAACSNGCKNIVVHLLEKGADINLSSKYEGSPLYAACKSGHESIVLLLLDKGADVNSKRLNGSIRYSFGREIAIDLYNNVGDSPLYAACTCKKECDFIVKVLLEHGADANLCAIEGLTPLFISSYNGYKKIVQLLLNNGAMVNSPISHRARPPSVVFFKESFKTVKTVKIKLTEESEENSADPMVFNPLCAACYRGHTDILQLLWAKGVDVNQHGHYGIGLLFLECQTLNFNTRYHGFSHLVCYVHDSYPFAVSCCHQFLLDNCADVNFFSTSETTVALTGLKRLIQADEFTLIGVSPLYLACKRGLTKIVQSLVKKMADVNFLSKEGTPLHAASEYGSYSIVQLLLENGAEINLGSDNVGSALHMACKAGNDSVVKLLLDKCADINSCFQNVGSPLYVACDNGRDSIIHLLLERGAEVNTSSENVGSPLFAACKCGNYKTVKLLLENDAYVNICLEKVGSPLYAACAVGRRDIVQLLLDSGADVNSFSEHLGCPLHASCKIGRTDIARILFNNRAEVNLFSEQAGSPLYAACESAYGEIVMFLLDAEAEINKSSKEKGSPLYAACKHQCYNIVKLLLERGAEVNACSEQVGSPLHGACENGAYDIVKLLLDKSADVNSFSELVGSPLHAACKDPKPKTVKLLLERGAEVNLFSEHIGNPLHIAVENGNLAIVKLFLEKGADVNKFSEKVQSPLHAACEKGYDDIIQILLEKGARINQVAHDGISPLYKAFRNGHDSIVKRLLEMGAEINTCFDNVVHPLLTNYSKGPHDNSS